MKLDFATYKDKVMGCWAGKNIGGVLGAPFEGKRQFNDIDFYAQDLTGGPPPNDDLDLQIVWLAAVERYGRNVNAAILGEYWLSYVIPNWVEYGTGKANLVAGLTPPLSGWMNNQYRDSCGCFIRSEIWACLAPGHPELAVRYAYEDGIVDHSGEGVYGEVFCAALESAAFVESDTFKLIDIGLSYIPVDCAVANCVNAALECYKKKLPIREARVYVHNAAPGTFGLQGTSLYDAERDSGMEIGEPGYDCPENVGIAVLGWLYGEGDFGKALCAAVACGEDTDCTGATLGAIMGIVSGASGLPEKWTAPLGGKISTMCIDRTSWGIWVPNTVTELTDRVLRVTPRFLDVHSCDILAENGYNIFCAEGDGLYCREYKSLPRLADWRTPRGLTAKETVALSPFCVRYSYVTHDMIVDYLGEPYFTAGEPRTIKLTLSNTNILKQQMWCRVTLYTPEGVYLPNGDSFMLQLNTLYKDFGELELEIDASDYAGAKLDIIADVSFEGRHTSAPVRITLLRK